MSGYTEFARTNTITLKDINNFENALDAYEVDPYVRIITPDENQANTVALIFNDGLPPKIDLDYLDDVTDEMREKDYDDVTDLIADHLVNRSVCVLTGSYTEGTRTCGGFALAFDNTNDAVIVNTDSIYDLAEQRFNMPKNSLKP